MLTLDGNQVEVLWDALLPEGVRMLPGDDLQPLGGVFGGFDRQA